MLKKICAIVLILAIVLMTGCTTTGPSPADVTLPGKFTMEMPSMAENGSQKTLAKTLAVAKSLGIPLVPDRDE